jgi:hypothetical protein
LQVEQVFLNLPWSQPLSHGSMVLRSPHDMITSISAPGEDGKENQATCNVTGWILPGISDSKADHLATGTIKALIVWSYTNMNPIARRGFRGFVVASLGLILAAAAPKSSQETVRQYLSGRDKDNTVPWQFYCTAGRKSGYWTTIPVPSQWELHGFGTLNYSRDDTANPVEQGRYRRTFRVAAAWAGLRVFLVFEGVMTDTQVTINGQSAGPQHQGGFYRFKYEVTNLLRFGSDNGLEVTVDKLSANPSVNRAERQGDYWIFGGIYRPVYLEAVPPQFIERTAIDARADGTLNLQAFVNGEGSDLVEAQVVELNGKPLGAAFSAPVASGKAVLQTKMVSPRLWSAETPNLYYVQTRLKTGGQITHRRQDRFGFRTFEVRAGDGLYLNGRRVVLKGVNRHSFWPDSGRCLNEAIHRGDIALIQDMNMNAVRMSHYPPDQPFLDLCDELGLYVLDELGGWQKPYDTEVGRRLVEATVTRDVNHPAILFWDNGNEGGWNTELDGEFARWDPQARPVLHPWTTFSNVNTDHYETYESTKSIYANSTIYMPTEFLHGLYDGGIGAGFEDYWDVMLKSRVLGGGFFWVLADEGATRPDTGALDLAGNRAPDGIVGPYREKEASFYTIKELWSPISIAERTLPPDFSGALTVENRYSFTDARQCTFAWQLRRLPQPHESGSGFKVIKEGTAPSPPIAPGGSGILRLNLPSEWKSADALALRVTDPKGRELWTWVWPLPNADRFRAVIDKRTKPDLTVTAAETAETLEVHAGDLTLLFSKLTGQIVSVQRGRDKFSLSNGPRPAAGEARLVSLENETAGNRCVITARYDGDLKSVVWRVRAHGWVDCECICSAQGPHDFLGVSFDYPEDMLKSKRWLGDGPYRVWKNRLRGVTFGVWENAYNDTATGYSGWLYPEFKGYFANVRWLQLGTPAGPITAIVDGEHSLVQVLQPKFPDRKLAVNAIAAFPAADISFLRDIPPMGNKFHTAAETGPQGQVNPASAECTISFSLHFGGLSK